MTAPGAEEDFQRRVLVLTVVLLLPVPFLMRWVDQPVAIFFHGYRDTAWVHAFAVITNLANGVIWYSLGLLGIAAAYLRRRSSPDPIVFQAQRRAWLFMILAMASSGIAESVIKVVIGRDRPRFMFAGGGATFHPLRWDIANASLPSGHTQSITSAMLSLAFIYPPLTPLYAVVAVLVAASRVVIGAHYVGDVFGGAWLGIVAVLWWRRRFERGGIALDLRLTAKGRPLPAASSPPQATSN